MKHALAAFALLLVVLAPLSVDAETLRIDGEVYARKTASLMPPAVDTVWQFNITQLAPDGAPVEKGDVVLAFDGNELNQQLMAKNSQLAEKQRELERLLLDLAERERTERLATAEAAANLEKAERKTSQPPEVIPGIEYRKLVVARAQAEKKLALARRREQLSAVQRREERRLLTSEVDELRADIAELQGWIVSLNVTAPRSGLMMHKSSWGGEKYDVGSQVWRGQAVAEIPDTSTLAVRAELPERDLHRVDAGTPVRVVVEGGAGIAVRGKVASIGRAVRSKSRVQPIPVLDMEVVLDDPSAPLKPGQAVRVEVQVPDVGRGNR
ncbi:MAG TPA: HlyD family efflux transporter periplasmic adaptor subunit [Xanthomonadaceae bacterium]|nr:HlyD family efflux transporter periplasmic adaptor subunit [Xanthomonadaceae bacterium]